MQASVAFRLPDATHGQYSPHAGITVSPPEVKHKVARTSPLTAFTGDEFFVTTAGLHAQAETRPASRGYFGRFRRPLRGRGPSGSSTWRFDDHNRWHRLDPSRKVCDLPEHHSSTSHRLARLSATMKDLPHFEGNRKLSADSRSPETQRDLKSPTRRQGLRSDEPQIWHPGPTLMRLNSAISASCSDCACSNAIPDIDFAFTDTVESGQHHPLMVLQQLTSKTYKRRTG